MKSIVIFFAILALPIFSCSVTHELEVYITTTDPTIKNLYYKSGNVYIFSIFDGVQNQIVYSTTFLGDEASEKIVDPNIPTGEFLIPTLEVQNGGTVILIGDFITGSTYRADSPYGKTFSIYDGQIVDITLQLSTP